MGKRLYLIVGDKFGRLTYISEAGKSEGKDKRRIINVVCDCGKEKTVILKNILKKVKPTVSCGCYNKEQILQRSFIHGHTKNHNPSITYSSWSRMWQRCTNIQHEKYIRYGGRGITICDRWKDFSNFLEDMGIRPSVKYTLDRIDNNGNYCKENCKWSTQKEQRRNCSVILKISFDGKEYSLIEVADEFGISYKTVRSRIYRGISFHEALGFEIP